MGTFSRGLVVGIGLGILFAPMPGQDMRQLLAERLQKLRGQLPDNEQLAHMPLQISNYTGKVSDTLKSASVQVKDLVSQHTDEAQPTRSKSAQTTEESSDTTDSGHSPFPADIPTLAKPVDILSLHASLNTIPGMEPEIQRALEAQGIGTLQQLLEQTPTKQERTNLAHKAGLNAHRLKTLTDRADLMRLPGVDGDIATMFEEAGVNGCKDLQHRNPENLQTILTELYEKKQIALPPPALEQIMQWVAEARGVVI